jgi:hypothetical protein
VKSMSMHERKEHGITCTPSISTDRMWASFDGRFVSVSAAPLSGDIFEIAHRRVPSATSHPPMGYCVWRTPRSGLPPYSHVRSVVLPMATTSNHV